MSSKGTPVSGAIEQLVQRAPGLHILVVGDCMLDVYVTGAADRISPEAPVPVVNVARRRYVAGGAANVAANIRSMGAVVSLAGLTGADDSGTRLRGELQRLDVDCSALVSDVGRPTTTKTRVTAAGQQIVRFDEEYAGSPDHEVFVQLQERCASRLAGTAVCVVSDYAKGSVPEAFCRWIIKECTERDIPVVVDPKSRDLSRYRGASVITPNLKEAAQSAGVVIGTSAELAQAASRLLRTITPSALLVTRGEDGMSLFESGVPERHLPAVVNEVADVTGAGDTVAAALAIGLGCGFDLPAAMAVANVAAGVAVSHQGTWAVTGGELREAGMRFGVSQAQAVSSC